MKRHHVTARGVSQNEKAKGVNADQTGIIFGCDAELRGIVTESGNLELLRRPGVEKKRSKEVCVDDSVKTWSGGKDARAPGWTMTCGRAIL
jgi:hypothetical protein